MHRVRLALLAALLAGTAFVTACSKDDKTTNPTTTGEPFSVALPIGGGSGQITFHNTGDHPYHCNQHSSMHGTVTVSAGGADSAVVTVNNFAQGFMPPTVTIAPHGYVRWVNISTSQTHSAVSD